MPSVPVRISSSKTSPSAGAGWVIDDIEEFFDRVNHDKLCADIGIWSLIAPSLGLDWGGFRLLYTIWWGGLQSIGSP
jgi:hypothetical protein